MLFIIRMRPPTSVPYTLRQCSDMSRYNSMKWASPYIINGIFESHRAYCCERGRREVASAGTNDLRSHLKLLSQYKIAFKTCSSSLIFLLTCKYLSTARFLFSLSAQCISLFTFLFCFSFSSHLSLHIHLLVWGFVMSTCSPPPLNCLYSVLQCSSSRYASVLRWTWGCPIFSSRVREDSLEWIQSLMASSTITRDCGVHRRTGVEMSVQRH